MTEMPSGSDDEQIDKLRAELRQEYSVAAPHYDAERSLNKQVLEYFERSYATIDSLMGPTSEETIHIEMPVGTGRFVRFLRGRGRVHRIVGLDVAQGMLQMSRRMCADDRATTVCYGDAFALQFPDDSVDLITSLRFFHLFPKRYWSEILREMHRVLRPGGMLITDLRNLLRGGALGMIKEYRDRWRDGDRRHYFISPFELATVFDGWTSMQTRGVGLDGAYNLTAFAPRLASRLEHIASTSALRYFTKELVVAVRKP